MSFRWPFSKTYTITCPDGTPRIIHRNIDDAFPFALSDGKATGNLGLQLPDGTKANVDADIAKAIANITYEIDESNRSLMMDYRNAYIAFQTDPCGKSEWLTLQTEDIRVRRDRLQEQQRLLRTLVELATNRVASRQEMLEVLRQLVDRMSPNVATMITINEMDEAERVAIEMADGTQ